MNTRSPSDFSGTAFGGTTFRSPCLVQPEELLASERLSRLCFGGPDVNLDEDLPVTYHPPRRGGTYVITHQGAPVSQISIFHHRIKCYDGIIRVGSIGGVCTHPEYRGHGLAGRLMEHCTQQLAQEGARLMLISGERGLYTRLGNALAGRYMGFTVDASSPDVLSVESGQGKGRPTPADLALRPATRSDAHLCSRLYQAEPIHFIRQVSDFAEALSHPNGYIHADQWIIERGGQPLAYLFLGIPWDFMDQPDAGIRHVAEYAGSRVALVDALRVILKQNLRRNSVLQLSWPVAWQDVDLIQLLEDGGFHGMPIYLPEHTMRIINFAGLMEDLRPYLRARLPLGLLRGLRFEQNGPLLGGTVSDRGTIADRYTITRGADCLELDGAAMTRLVMGDAEARSIQAPGVIQDVISALFPLPSFLPGLNYQ